MNQSTELELVPESKAVAKKLPPRDVYKLYQAGEIAREVIDEWVTEWTLDGKTQKWMSGELGCSQQTISNWQKRLGVRSNEKRGRPSQEDLPPTGKTFTTHQISDIPGESEEDDEEAEIIDTAIEEWEEPAEEAVTRTLKDDDVAETVRGHIKTTYIKTQDDLETAEIGDDTPEGALEMYETLYAAQQLRNEGWPKEQRDVFDQIPDDDIDKLMEGCTLAVSVFGSIRWELGMQKKNREE